MLQRKFNKLEHKSFITKIIYFIVVVVLITHFTSLDVGTGSIKYKYLLSTHLITPVKGDYAVIKGHDTKYFHNLTFIKKIVGIEGDRIIIKNKKIYLNDELVGGLLEKTKDGKPLTHIQEQIIPKNYVFVAGEHQRSFDSRYQEFGLVGIDFIKGRAFGIW